MTYREMRALFVQLARYDGRLSVLSARNHARGTQWAVCLRDHARQTWLCVERPSQFAAFARARSSAVWSHGERLLSDLSDLPEPRGARMSWTAVLRTLGALEQIAPRWSLAEIVATRPPFGAPRYRLVLRNEPGGARQTVDSYAAFERLMQTGDQET